MSFNTQCLFWMQKVQHCRLSPFAPERGSGCLPANRIYPEDKDTGIMRQSSRWQEQEICHKKKQRCCSDIFFDLVLSELSFISYSIWAFHSCFYVCFPMSDLYIVIKYYYLINPSFIQVTCVAVKRVAIKLLIGWRRCLKGQKSFGNWTCDLVGQTPKIPERIIFILN